MFCANCGQALVDNAPICKQCGWSPFGPPQTSKAQSIGDDAGMRMLLPVGRSPWAIAAGYLGLFSVLFLPAPFALLCGILAVREIRRDPKKHGLGRAWFGIVMGALGSLGLVLGVIVPLVAALVNGK